MCGIKTKGEVKERQMEVVERRDTGEAEGQKRRRKTEILILFNRDLSFSLLSISVAHHSSSKFDVGH